jgi:hypothetical protein
VLAEAEIALVSRDLNWTAKALDAARVTLERHGDCVNAAHARYLEIRRLLLIGRLDEAERALTGVPAAVPPPLKVTHELIIAGIAMRRLQARVARNALARAAHAARQARIPALLAEVEGASAMLDAPVARLTTGGEQRLLRLDEVEALRASPAFVVDACHFAIRQRRRMVPLATRPVLLALARVLAEAWPRDVSRNELVARAFRLRLADESHRARLRVEIGRLRKLLVGLASIEATPSGFVLKPRRAREVLVLVPPVEDRHAAVLALLADGESWSTSALAQALDASQRTVQRSLDALALTCKVQSFGRGRARRWLTPAMPGIATLLLLPAALPTD